MWRYGILALLLVGCQLDSDKAVRNDKFTFKTGNDTQLFFKNLRQSYYEKEVNEAAKFDVYRLTKRFKNDSLPVINLAIVNNYLRDEAYLLIEPSKVAEVMPLIIHSLSDTTDTITPIRLEAQNRESMLAFASAIYQDLLRGNHFKIALQDTIRPILHSPLEREAFRITMFDYFRLVRSL